MGQPQTDEISGTATVFKTHISNIENYCNQVKRDICTLLKTDNIDNVTPDNIKACNKISKSTISDYLLSLINLSDTMCKCDYVCKFVVKLPNVLVDNYQNICNDQYNDRIKSIESSCDDIKVDIKNLLDNSTNSNPPPGSFHSSILEKLQHLEDRMDKLANQATCDANLSLTNDTVFNPEQPNTVSPHSGPTKPVCEPYVKYVSDVITDDLKGKLLTLVEDNKANFKRIGDCRDCIYFGEYGYRYTGGRHEPCRSPEVIQDLLESVRPHMSNPSGWINSCLITRYNTGQDHIPPHRDDELFFDPDSEILTVSIGAKRQMSFSYNSSDITRELDLDDCSVLIFSRFAQDFWKHEIKSDESVPDMRYSFTFRHIAPHFVNSTAVIGDSNTKYLQFGMKRGTFGAWMPGKRLEALHIEEIPGPEEIGPYRNILIHTGVNNIKSQSRKSNKTLVNELEVKCKNICEVYPRTKLFISMLLPTKSSSLNYRVNELNNLILDMSFKYKNILVIDNADFGGINGNLKGEFGRWDVKNNCPNSVDILHLGIGGICKFVKKIKSSLIKSKNDKTGVKTGAAVQKRHRSQARS